MTVASLKKLIVEFGDRRVIDQVSVACAEGAVIGLIGGNGAGKSTLLNVLAGELTPTAGERSLDRKVRIGYLRQNSGLDGERTVQEELRSVVQEGLDAIERLPVTQDPTEYARLQAIIDATDAYQIDVRIRTVLQGMGFSDLDLSMRAGSLSGGEQTRLALCRLLIAQPNLLLLDEPTNHLDFKMLHWLETYISNYKGSVIVVSHDRFFLDRCATEIWDMERGRLRCYKGNYSAFKEQKALYLKERTRLYEQQEKEAAKLSDYIDRNLVRASTSAMAKSRRKQLERMERIEKPRETERKLTLRFDFDRASGNDVLQCRNLAAEVGEGKRLFSDLNLTVQKGEKIAIVGDNGVGKTTLLSVLAGQLPPADGRIRWGTQVSLGQFCQALQFEDGERTVLEELAARFPTLTNHDLRSVLALVSFPGEAVELKIGTLSGGERARFQFAVLMLERRNTLLLDEPTNHLDLPAREEVERALEAFSGTLLMVSHDRYFLSTVPDRVLHLTTSGVQELKKLEDYWNAEPETETPAPRKKVPSPGYKGKEERAKAALRRQERARLERELHEVESTLKQLEEKMSAAQSNYQELETICRQMEELRARQDQLLEAWLLLEDEE